MLQLSCMVHSHDPFRRTINILTEGMKLLPILRQMQESMLRQMLHVRVASDT